MKALPSGLRLGRAAPWKARVGKADQGLGKLTRSPTASHHIMYACMHYRFWKNSFFNLLNSSIIDKNELNEEKYQTQSYTLILHIEENNL